MPDSDYLRLKMLKSEIIRSAMALKKLTRVTNCPIILIKTEGEAESNLKMGIIARREEILEQEKWGGDEDGKRKEYDSKWPTI